MAVALNGTSPMMTNLEFTPCRQADLILPFSIPQRLEEQDCYMLKKQPDRLTERRGKYHVIWLSIHGLLVLSMHMICLGEEALLNSSL